MKKKILSIIAIILIFFIVVSPVAFAADITIDSNSFIYEFASIDGGGVFWVSPEIGYVFGKTYTGPYIWWAKTTNGGSSWSQTQTSYYAESISCWADWNTPEDNGTLIHITYLRDGVNQIKYRYFDTSDDSFSSEITVESVCGTEPANTIWDNVEVSITKTYGKTLAIAYKSHNTNPETSLGFETSIDGGNNWIAKDNPLESYEDNYRLFPADTDDPDDIWMIYWDDSANETSLKTYDYSSNTWDEDLISVNMSLNQNLYLQMDSEIRPYDKHLIHAAWNEYNTANSSLKVWDIDSSSITAKTNVIDTSSGYFQTGVFIDPAANRLYIAYLKGTIGSSVGVYYQYSDDGADSWSGEVSYATTLDDHRAFWFGAIKETLGGRFMPVWFNSDLFDTITNYTNSIEISANEFSDPAIAPDYVIDCPTCTDNLTSSGNFTSNETFTGGPPGFSIVDDAASESGAPPIWLWGWVGMFAIIVPGFFVTYMERKHGAGNGTLILRMGIALLVMGLLVTWGRFDWWMIVFYVMLAIAPALMSRQYDFGGAGGISQWGWIGFCGTSWIGLTIINRILEGQFLQAAESDWWCSIQLFNEFRVFDLFTVPVLNFQFFTRGIPALLRWDYSFFGGNAELIQYFLYTITAVVAFILFIILVGLLFNAFRAR